MQDNDEFKIQLKVANKPYPIYCKRSEEELYRKAAKAINDKLSQYSANFAAAKLEWNDFLVMTAIHFSIESLLLKKKEDISPLMESVERLDEELERYIQSILLTRLN